MEVCPKTHTYVQFWVLLGACSCTAGHIFTVCAHLKNNTLYRRTASENIKASVNVFLTLFESCQVHIMLDLASVVDLFVRSFHID